MMNMKADVLNPTIVNETTDGGLKVSRPTVVRSSVRGRLSRNSAREQEMWDAQGVTASYSWITFDGEIEKGWFLQIGDRRFRVLATGNQSYAHGTIASHWNYPVEEVRLA